MLEVQTREEIVWAIAKHAIGQLGYTDCVVYLFDELGEYLIQRAAHGPKNPIDFDINNPIKLKRGQGIVGSVAQSGIAEIISDTGKDDRYHVDDAIRLSEITVPIMDKNKVIGVIDSENEQANFFTNFDLEILTTIGSMASTKLSQAQMQKELIDYRDKLEKKVHSKTKELQKALDQLQQSHDEIKEKNTEKEVLLKEVHHRVKNNMQIISSLLNMHMDTSNSDRELEVFRDCQTRIQSMAIIHEQLYAKLDLAKIGADIYVAELCEGLFYSFKSEKPVRMVMNVDPLVFDIEQFIPVGLILNELIINSLKHAFADQTDCKIKIVMQAKDKLVKLTVSDNGIGITDDIEIGKSSMGLNLIPMLVQQLDGELERNVVSKGTSFTITFPTNPL